MDELKMARETGLEPATSGVTGRRSNQLSYSPATTRCVREAPNRTCVRRSQHLEDGLDLRPADQAAFHFLFRALLD